MTTILSTIEQLVKALETARFCTVPTSLLLNPPEELTVMIGKEYAVSYNLFQEARKSGRIVHVGSNVFRKVVT